MLILVDVAIVALLIFALVRGYKRGMVRGVFGFVSIIVAVILAQSISVAFAPRFEDAIRPFIGGQVDSKMQSILSPKDKTDDEETPSVTADEDAAFDNGRSAEDFLRELNETDPTAIKRDPRVAAYCVLRSLGIPPGLSDKIATKVAEVAKSVTYDDLNRQLGDRLTAIVTRCLVFLVVFILIMIILTIVANLIKLTFNLPGLRQVDGLLGAAFSVLKMLLFLFAITIILRYAGILKPEIVEKTSLLNAISQHNPIANLLGI
ncbi:MAG: CvpA family protein [Oscillospiraceae bacterium]|nr:CvpA family protein [Oscillospiraceae bacterium]